MDLQYKPRLTVLRDNPNITIIHLDGHKRSIEKTSLDIMFSRLDKAVRKELRHQRPQ